MNEKTFRIQAAAEMSGIPEALLRLWERRYKILKPKRTASGYRAYTEADIEVLRRLKQLTEEGMSIGDAAKLVASIKREVRERGERRDSPPQLEAWKHQVLIATQRLDQPAVERVVDEAVATMPPTSFFEEFAVPLLREAGERWHTRVWTVAEEHLLSHAIRQRLVSLLHQAPRLAKRHVVCACFPNEQHELGLVGAALQFRAAGWRVTFLGARTPPDALSRVIRASAPDVVALSVLVNEGAAQFEETLEAMMAERSRAQFVVGGRAAELHHEIVSKSGAAVLRTPADWYNFINAERAASPTAS